MMPWCHLVHNLTSKHALFETYSQPARLLFYS